MADQTTRFNVVANTDALVNLTNVLKNFDQSAQKVTQTQQQLSTISATVSGAIDRLTQVAHNYQLKVEELNRSSDNTGRTFDNLGRSFTGFNQAILNADNNQKRFSDTQKQLQSDLERTASSAEKQAKLLGGVGNLPPRIPPSAPPGAPAPLPEDEAKANAIRVRAQLVQDTLNRLKISAENLDAPGLEKIRVRVQALAQAIGTTPDALNRLQEAFRVIETGSLEVTSRPIARVIKSIQDLQKTRDDITSQQQKDQEKVSEAEERAAARTVARTEKEVRARQAARDALQTAFAQEAALRQKQEDDEIARLRRTLSEQEKVAAERRRIAEAPIQTKAALGGLGIGDEALARLSPDRLKVVQTEIDRLNNLFQRGKIDAESVAQAFRRLNGEGIEPLDASARRAYDALNKIDQAVKEQIASAERGTQANNLLSKALEGIGFTPKVFAGLSEQRAQVARVSINNLNQALLSGKVSAEDLDRAVASLSGRLVGPLSAGAAYAAAQLGQIKVVANEGTNAVIKIFEKLERIVVSVILRRFTGLVITQFRYAFQESTKFNIDLTKIAINANITGDAVDILRDKFIGLTTEIGRSRTEIANAGVEVFRSKLIDASNAENVLNDSLKLARATFSDTTTAGKILVDTLGLFNLKATDSPRVIAALSAATRLGRTELKDLEGVIDTTGLAATHLGLSMEDLLAAFVSLRDRGVPANRAATTLNLLFNRLIQSSDEVNKLFFKFGYESAQAAVKSLGLQAALRIIADESKHGAGRIKEVAEALLGADPNISKITDTTANLQKEMKKFDEVNEKVAKTFEERWNRATQKYRGNFLKVVDGLKVLVVESTDFLSKQVNALDNISDKLNLFGQEHLRNVRQQHEQEVEVTESSNKVIERQYSGLYANLRTQLANYLITARNQYQNNSQLVKEDFRSLDDLIKKITTDSNNAIKQSQRDIQTFSQTIAKQQFDRRLQLLPPQEQFSQLRDRYNELLQSGRQAFATGDVDKAKAAYNDAANILSKFEDVNIRLAQQQRKSAIATDREFRTHVGNIDRLLGDTDKLTKENVRSAEAQLRLAQNRVKTFRDEYIRANALNELESKRLQIEYSRLQLENQRKQAELRDTGPAAKKKIDEEERATQNRIRLLTERERELQQKAAKEQVGIATAPEDIARRLAIVKNISGKFDVDFNRDINNTIAALVRFSQVRTDENLKEVSKQLDIVRPKLTGFANDIRTFPRFGGGLFGASDEDKQRTIEAIDEINNLGKSFKRQLQKTDTQTQLDDVRAQLAELKGKAPATAIEIANAFKGASLSTAEMTTNIRNFNAALDQSLGKLNGIVAAINVIKATPFIGPPAPVPVVPGQQHGGLINFGPTGVDNVLIRVSRGEYVMDEANTRKFYPQLVAMSKGFANGGLVGSGNSTSVGNITVNITSESTEQANIRNIGQAINREIRRGTLRFGK